MVGNILLILVYLLSPAGVMWLCRKAGNYLGFLISQLLNLL